MSGPIRIPVRGYGMSRTHLSPSEDNLLEFGPAAEPVTVAVPHGVSELILQGRACGDFYAEASGPKGCVSHCHSDAIDAVRGALAKISGAA